MKTLLARPLHLLAFVFALTVLGALGALILYSSSDFERVQLAPAHLDRIHLLQESQSILQDAQLRLTSRASAGDANRFAAVRRNLSLMSVVGGPAESFTRERLERMDRLLAQADGQPGPALAQALGLVTEMLQRETQLQTNLVDDLEQGLRAERRLAFAALIGFACLAPLSFWAFRQRILRPIASLRTTLSRSSDGGFTPLSLERVDPLLLPFVESYNQVVGRLEQLEKVDRDRTLSLQQEVQAAIAALLKQQQSLARAERLSAAAEVSAALAHELRNPIAGIHVTLMNLREELTGPEAVRRIDLIVAELQRMTRLLNGLLQQSSHAVEPRIALDVGRLVHELATLIRYQLPAQIRLAVQAPRGLRCRLPVDGLRQGLLNLVLNSVQAMQADSGEIQLHVERSDRGVCFRVQDDGPGFSEDILSGAVRPFATSHETGTGLGLAIVRRLARELGGELTMSNRSPRGACVMLTVPCDDRHLAAD